MRNLKRMPSHSFEKKKCASFIKGHKSNCSRQSGLKLDYTGQSSQSEIKDKGYVHTPILPHIYFAYLVLAAGDGIS